jgi:Tol biopolymer transport system component
MTMKPGALFLLLGICFSYTATGQHPARHPYASDQPMKEPTIFGAGVISTGDYETHPAFSPDGQTLYFVKSTPNFSFWTIVVSRFVGGRWTEPEVSPFSGRYSDADPFITADGHQLYYISARPAPNATPGAARNLDIWVMDKTATGWGEPRNLGSPINSAGAEWYPTLARDGTIYFGSERPGGKGGTDLYCARLVAGKYAEPENLGAAINTEFDEYEPFIAPDESVLLFMAAGRKDGRAGSADLFVSYRRNGVWTKAENLGEPINSDATEYAPKISPDGKYFFFASTRGRQAPQQSLSYADLLAWLRGPRNGLGDIYQVDIGALRLAH